MSYAVKVIVYAVDDPGVLGLVRKAIEADGARVEEFTVKAAADGEKELYAVVRFGDPKVLIGIVRRVEAVRGAAVMAATEPALVSVSKRFQG